MTTTEALQEALRHMEWARDHVEYATEQGGLPTLATLALVHQAMMAVKAATEGNAS